jgi:threonine synthase
MWKVFDELEQMGWIGRERPRMVSVQAEGCSPIVKAYREGKEESQFFEGANTVAAGLRVPKALGDFLILKAVREQGYGNRCKRREPRLTSDLSAASGILRA